MNIPFVVFVGVFVLLPALVVGVDLLLWGGNLFLILGALGWFSLGVLLGPPFLFEE